MRKLLMILLPLALLFAGCNKDPGEGGRAQIHGRVIAQNINNATQFPIGDPYPFPEHRVYIIYGDGHYHDDDVRTGADGAFRFTGLRKGTYKIYTISQKQREASDQSGTYAVERTVEISDNNDEMDVGDLLIERWRGWQGN